MYLPVNVLYHLTASLTVQLIFYKIVLNTHTHTRDSSPGFSKPGARGNLDNSPNPKPGFGLSAKPAGFGFVFAPRSLRLMEYYKILGNSKHVFD